MLVLLAAVSLIPVQGTVVMIHGAGGGGWECAKWRPVFAKAGWRVIDRDLLPVAGQYERTSFDDYVEQVVDWTPKEGKVVYVGASMGGILALKANEKRPADAIVLVNAVPPAGVGKRRGGEALPAIVRWANGPLKDTEVSMPDSDRQTILWAWKRWRDESGTVMNTIRDGVLAQKPKCPVLVVIGEADTDISPKDSRALAKWARADVKAYPKMSHVGPLLSKQASEVARTVELWLRHKAN